jgi:hypothetical protein
VVVIHKPEKPASVEQSKACDAGVSMELTYGLGKDRPAELSLLDEPLRLGEPASVAGGAAIDLAGLVVPVPERSFRRFGLVGRQFWEVVSLGVKGG